MKRQHIDFSKTGFFQPIILDYAAGVPGVKPFYSYSPALSSFKQVIEDKSKEHINRKMLVEVLNEQNSKLETINPKLKENINLLLSDKTFTVTTGHQLCLFTGPLYSVYKILSTIKLADELKKSYPGYNFVPVFWMVTEDHDFKEINHIHLYGKTIEWTPAPDELPMAGKWIAGKFSSRGISDCIQQVKAIIGEGENAEYLMNLFGSAYADENNLYEATHLIVHRLFGKYGLVMLDASDARLKSLFGDIMKEELLKSSSHQYVSETIKELSARYHVQVKPRDINLFYLHDGIRSRIVKTGKEYIVLESDIKFTVEGIVKELVEHPENFSPNVVLRPLYQEKILPNLAYIGGPGETSYWLEYKRMFQHFNVNYPMLALRNSVLWIEEPVASRMDKLSISPQDLFLDTEALVKVLIEKIFDHAFNIDNELKEADKLFTALAEKAAVVDVTLKSFVEAEKQRQLSALKHIEEKILRAQKKKHETVVAQLRKVKEKLFPEGQLQERYENFIPYYLKYGDRFFDLLLDNFDALPQRFLVLEDLSTTVS